MKKIKYISLITFLIISCNALVWKDGEYIGSCRLETWYAKGDVYFTYSILYKDTNSCEVSTYADIYINGNREPFTGNSFVYMHSSTTNELIQDIKNYVYNKKIEYSEKVKSREIKTERLRMIEKSIK